MELTRRKIKPIEKGDLCFMDSFVNIKMKDNIDYHENGNIMQSSHYTKTQHIADVQFFYCSSDNPFNSKDFIEIIPILYDYDSYSQKIFSKSISKRIKFIVRRSDYVIVENRQTLEQKQRIENNLNLMGHRLKIKIKR